MAVSLGRKPSPGGERYVCRRLERTIGGSFAEGCEIRPMPILFALPSRPRAIIVGEEKRLFGGWKDEE